MLLLDTHVLLWLRVGDPRLGSTARNRVDQAWQSGDLAVSAVTFWEIAMLKGKNRIRIPHSPEHWRQVQLEQGLIEVPLDGAIGLKAVGLDEFHADPVDRFIVATAIEKGCRLLTADQRFLEWPGELARLTALK